MNQQTSLFGSTVGPASDRPEVSALDEMFAASRRYRRSAEYVEMLKFISRFPRYSPFNCLLLHTQNPAISHVATAGQWARRFNRRPTLDARPLVILAPMSPVLFVYDLRDTEGDPVPAELIRPFQTQGTLEQPVWDRTVKNAASHGITVRDSLLAHQHAGSAIRLNTAMRRQYEAMKLESWAKYLVLVNKGYCLEDKYSSLAHELAHIFCGHVGIDDDAWWEDRPSGCKDVVEVEAESVAYLVCQRRDLLVNSEKYLSGYRTGQVQEMPLIGLNAVLTATTYIEEMGRPGFRRRKSRYKAEEEPKA